jgi:acetyltransferase-like isoleucine patch superfamily enzyme
MRILPTRVRRRLLEGPLGEFARDAARRYPLTFGDPDRVHVGREVHLNDAMLNVSSGEIRIGDHTFLGHHVSLLAGTHDVAVRGAERKHAVPPTGCDITIGAGVWIASNATVLGPCTIGDDAVVAAGALVTDDVPARGIVAGVPARLIRMQD